MNYRYLLIALLLNVMAVLPSSAQPSWVKKAAKSVFTLKTFSADGTLLGSSCGFFVGEKGEAVSSYAPFKGASRAVVIDAQGKEWPVEAMLGANETYDAAKFRVNIKKSQPLTVATQNLSEGSVAWLLPYRETKPQQSTVSRAEMFGGGSFAYYTVALSATPETVGAPLLNDEGQAVGLMQQPSAADADQSYAVSVLFADSLSISGLSLSNQALRNTNIKKALPADLNQAQLMLFMGSSTLDSAAYAQMVDDFIAQFPHHHDGYIYRAQLMADADRYADADRDMAQAVKMGEKPDEAHYSYSQLIYQKLLYKPQPPYEPWTYERALEEVREAWAVSPEPVYRQHEAHILFAQKQYAEASAIYDQLFDGPLRSAELFFEASRCRLMMADTLGQLQLLDSAVATFSRPYLKEAAPFILSRAQARIDAGHYREAVSDLNDYEQLMSTQVNDQFYYMRHQAEIKGRLFQQALNDIDRAITMNPQNEFYLAEKASLQVRVGLYDDAVQTAQECIRIAPDMSDGYLFLGVAQCLKGQKTEGVKNLQRARELGDEQAEGLIQTYGK